MRSMTNELPASAKTHALWSMSQPLWNLGFRPFYLLAAAFAATSVPWWMMQYLGWHVVMPTVDVNWHMHEMVFGVAIAVIVGFLYTAARAWTGLPTPTRSRLAALAALWIAGRVAMLVAPALPAAFIDGLFLPCAALPLYLVLKQSGNRRNLFLVMLLALLALANLTFHAAVLHWITLAPSVPIQAAILIIVVIESVIGARVIPMFTANGAPGTKPLVHPRRDRVAFSLLIAASLAWMMELPAPMVAALAMAAACANLVRLIGWKPQRTVHVPLLWILHLSYGWIPLGFFLLAAASLGVVPVSAAFHALTVGSMGGLIIAMMTRTALGHTGRALKAGRAELAMFCLIQVAAVTRLVAALDIGSGRTGVLLIAALCWAAAFGLYVAAYAPRLFAARIDGREG